MDYRKTAQEIYDHVGKKANIISAAHCATRLRLVIADNDKADKEYVENIDGVKGVFFAQGQMQIILGTGVVNKVYDEFIQIAGVSESSKEELKTGGSIQGQSGTETDQDTWRYFCPDHPGYRSQRIPDGNHGSSELHGKQRLPEHQYQRFHLCICTAFQ